MPVAQLDRALACGAKGRKFESYRAYQIHRGVAQSVARVVRDDEAVRSSRITPTRDYSRFDGRDFARLFYRGARNSSKDSANSSKD